jgi:hypothetical protein
MTSIKGKIARNACAVAVAAAMGVFSLTACSGQQSSTESLSQVSNESTNVSTDDYSNQEGETVSTPVGNLVCPAYWGDSVRVVDNISSGKGSIDFYGVVNNGQVKLFSLQFGDGAQGYELGTAPDASGSSTKVSLDISDIERANGWSDDDESRADTLQEGVNDLLSQIYALDGFESTSN